MKKQHLSLNDKFAKASLQEKAIAQDFFKAHLPQKVQKLINWKTLELQSGTFIDEDYHANYTDILYRVSLDQQPGYLFVLCEHQSTADRLMPFRLMNYLCKIWDRHLKQVRKDQTDNKAALSTHQLPLIFPLTVYHGKVSPYPYSLDLFDLFQKKELARDILLRPFPLIDLTITPDDEITRHGHAAVMELVQKYAYLKSIEPAIQLLKEQGLFAQIKALDHGQYLIKVVEYMIMKGEATSPDKMITALKDALPNDEDTIMTVAEQLKRQGREQGLQQGIHQVARNMLAEGLDDTLVAKTTGLETDILTKLKQELNQ